MMPDAAAVKARPRATAFQGALLALHSQREVLTDREFDELLAIAGRWRRPLEPGRKLRLVT